jgi:adenosine deaminase
MLDLGLLATINTDDPSISNCTLTDEYEIALKKLRIGYPALRQSILTAANSTFLPAAEQQALVKKFDALLPEPDGVDGRSQPSMTQI